MAAKRRIIIVSVEWVAFTTLELWQMPTRFRILIMYLAYYIWRMLKGILILMRGKNSLKQSLYEAMKSYQKKVRVFIEINSSR